MTEILESKDIVAKWKSMVFVEDECNCNRCIQQRTTNAWEYLLLLAYPAIGFIPRNRDIKINYNGYEQDAMYEKPERALSLTLANMKRLRTGNKKLRLATPKADRHRLVYCYDCGVIHLREKGMKYKDHSLCSACGERYTICSDCGELSDKYSVYSVLIKNPTDYEDRKEGIHYRLVCRDCLNNYDECHNCGTWTPKDKVIKIPYQRNGNGSINYYQVCPTCFDMHGVKCAQCKEPTMPRIGENHGPGVAYCPVCTEDRAGVQSHAFQPLVQRFHKHQREGLVGDKTLYFGYELEIDCYRSVVRDRNAMAHMIKDRVGSDRIYVVHDGTIENGAEVVSHPFTWERYRKIDKSVWDDMLMYCRNKGWKSNLAKCGMHIHTSKAAWGTLQIYKLLHFFYRKDNRKFIIEIAQRKPNKYCAMNEKDFNEAAYVAKNKKNREREHYSIINLNNKRGGEGKTIEFRMFAGTLEPLHFHKNLEFVHAIYYFTRDYPKSKMDPKEFKAFVSRRRKTYPSLTDFLKLKGGK